MTMRTSLRNVRAGPLLALLVLGSAIASSDATARNSHRYAIRGSLEATAVDHTAASPWLSLKGQLTAPAPAMGLHEGGNFAVLATLAASPLGCGGDLIFADDFDGD
jgi:hypothetical protein